MTPGSVSADGVALGGISLKDAPLASRIRIGGEFMLQDLAEPGVMSVLEQNFSSVTPNSAISWPTSEPERGQTSLTVAESEFLALKDEGLTIHADHLVWDHATRFPSYLLSDTPAQLVADLKEHITAVMTPLTTGALAGSVTTWSVVNEPLNYSQTAPALNEEGVFAPKLGDSYIIDAFKDAYALAPNADLCLNEVSADTVNARSNFLYKEVVSLLKRGAPISCVSFEGHITGNEILNPAYDEKEIQANIARFAALRNAQGQHLHVQFSEVDAPVADNGVQPVDPTALEAQALAYGHLAQACAAVSACDEFTTWGITDGESWAGAFYKDCTSPALSVSLPDVEQATCGAALMFSADGEAKPAAAAVGRAFGLPYDDAFTREGTQLSAPAGSITAGTAQVLRDAGTASTVFFTQAGTYDVGFSALGVGSPRVTVIVDGKAVCSETVAATTTSYACPVRLAEGEHTVGYQFDNADGLTTLTLLAGSLSTVDPLTRPRAESGGTPTASGFTFTAAGSISLPVVAEQDSVGQLQLSARALGSGLGAGTVTVAVDGVAAATGIATSSLEHVVSIPVTLAAGFHTVTITATAGTAAPQLAVTGLSYVATTADARTDIGSNVYTIFNPNGG